MKSKEYPLNIRIPAELYDLLEKSSIDLHVSKSEIVRTLLSNYFDKPNKEFEFLSISKWAKAVKTRDEFKCSQCKTENNLHAHHLRPVSQGGKNTLENGVTLCGECHSGAHSVRVGNAYDKISVGYRLPKWIVDWMREQNVSSTQLIENALIEEYRLDPPK